MARRIPVTTSVSPGYAPLDDLALDLFQVTQDGTVAKEFGRFPVAGGAAEVPDVPLADPQLRCAVRITDLAAGAPVYRSGPVGRLPGGPRAGVIGPDRIRLHRGGGNLGLDAPDGIPQALVDHVRDRLPAGFTLQRLEMDADAQGRYLLTFQGRYALLPFAAYDVTYRRGFGIAPGVDPGRALRVGVAWPQGPADNISGLPWLPALLALDVVLAGGVEAQVSAMARHIAQLMLLASGVTDLVPQTVSLTSIQVRPAGTEVLASVVLTAGALTGGVRVFDPSPPLVEA